jgi:hypothetical protein
MRPGVVGTVMVLFAQQGGRVKGSFQRTSATNNNHQAIPRKIITVKSFGVGEGIIDPSSYCSDQGRR